MKIAYQATRFRGSSTTIIAAAIGIIHEYAAQSLTLTLRQLYYQFVARDLLANTQRNYKRLGSIISDARRAGLIDWDAIVDRTRFVRKLDHWLVPPEIIQTASKAFRIDRWARQEHRPIVMIEKDALIGLLDDVCAKYDVPYFSCRGYPSDSAIWRLGRQMLAQREGDDQVPVVIHLGDHDPSGIDMTRDIADRLDMFSEGQVVVKRIALNMDQVQQYDPPPNPAKLSDSRAEKYVGEYGYDSWELDALEPSVIVDLITNTLTEFIDLDIWSEVEAEEASYKIEIKAVADNWAEAVAAVMKE